MNAIGKQLTILPEIDSTNNYAAQQITDGTAKHGDAFLALRQTAGKGQRGNQWYGGEGNIALSVVLQPHMLNTSQVFLLQMFIASTVAHTLNSYQKGFQIKWPNDIYFNDRKAAGILVENKIQGPLWSYAIAGIGINVNDATIATYNPNAIALTDVRGTQTDIVQLTQTLLQQLDAQWPLFLQNPEMAATQYNELLYKKGQAVQLQKGDEQLDVIIQHVSHQGALVCGPQAEQQYTHGQVKWIV
jgi:BirA family transcriptional regulator, biotin operon repressor / biotin---[acetyl-CoA-carboxylase] ligase